jgi:hypothetical protein
MSADTPIPKAKNRIQTLNQFTENSPDFNWANILLPLPPLPALPELVAARYPLSAWALICFHSSENFNVR